MGGANDICGRDQKCLNTFVENIERKRSFGRYRLNVKIDPREICVKMWARFL
jgi:hypothetical protein